MPISDGQKILIDGQSMDGLIGMYVTLRDRIKAMDEEHKAKTAPPKELLEYMNNKLLDNLNQIGGDSLKAATGTVYRTEKKSATISDPSGFRDFIIANELFDMVDWKANAKAVEDYTKEFESLPPGVTFNSIFVVGVRRPNEK